MSEPITWKQSKGPGAKVLFLDIDGVLHPNGNAHFIPGTDRVGGHYLFKWLPILLEVLAEFSDVEVVLSSSWRYCWRTDEELRGNLPTKLIEVIVGTTGRAFMGRYDAILDYVLRNKVSSYVIVDDDRNSFPENCPELVWTPSTRGIKSEKSLEQLRAKLKATTENSENRANDAGAENSDTGCDKAAE